MNSPFWHVTGLMGVIGFSIAIALSLVARRWFVSSDPGKVKLGAKILGLLGGAANARDLESEMRRRNVL